MRYCLFNKVQNMHLNNVLSHLDLKISFGFKWRNQVTIMTSLICVTSKTLKTVGDSQKVINFKRFKCRIVVGFFEANPRTFLSHIF